MRQVADEDGEVGADAGAEGKEEDDEDDDGDVEEGAATGGDVRQGYVADVGRLEVLQKVCFICVVPNDESAGYRWKEEVVGGHGC